MSEPGLQFNHVEILNDKNEVVLPDLTFSVLPGQKAAVIGPNGSGKTTLLLASCGVVQLRGKANLMGHDLTKSSGREEVRGKAVLVPEDLGDFFLADTVEQELEISARLQRWSRQDLVARVKAAWEESEIGGAITRSLINLSRKETLHLILAIVKMMEPWLVAWDGSQRQLDEENRRFLDNEWRKLIEAETMVLVSCFNKEELPGTEITIKLGSG